MWLCIPFVGLLLCIALLPLIRPVWWEKHRGLIVLFFCALFVIPLGIVSGPAEAAEAVLDCIVNDYLTFIVLLFGLFCVSGNISLSGDLAGSPRINVAILAMGTFLSSLIGTTGASMLLIRPLIRMNSWRKRKSHIIIFFIFMIANMGGCLTPLGDPPLLMGLMRGVPFLWSLNLFPILLFNMVLLLTLFVFLDIRAYRKDIASGLRPDISRPGTEVSINGKHNLIFILMIVAAVVLGGILPSTPAFQDASGALRGIHITGDIVLGYPSVIEMAVILTAAFLSFRTTDESVRRENHFSWSAISEVAVLFAGIFITMQPALGILTSVGPKLGLTKSYQMFWASGLFSGFLDNTPTYLIFLTTAGSLGFTSGITTLSGIIPPAILLAISAGSVFMGANSYIGNAPNFMIKAIADENGIHMPSFFGYLLWPLCILMPLFILDTLIFFM